jgi:hypothetical protein
MRRERNISGSVEEGKRDKVEEAKNREGREETLKSREEKVRTCIAVITGKVKKRPKP